MSVKPGTPVRGGPHEGADSPSGGAQGQEGPREPLGHRKAPPGEMEPSSQACWSPRTRAPISASRQLGAWQRPEEETTTCVRHERPDAERLGKRGHTESCFVGASVLPPAARGRRALNSTFTSQRGCASGQSHPGSSSALQAAGRGAGRRLRPTGPGLPSGLRPMRQRCVLRRG